MTRTSTGFAGEPSAPGDYASYVAAEWALFTRDASRAQAAQEAVAGVQVRRVVDVGCGGGQELLPFAHIAGVLAIGIDLSPDVGATRSRFAGRVAPGSMVAFVRGRAEALPLACASVDVVTCRLALPYVHNERAMSEIARVLRPGGLLLLKYHHVRYYIRRLAGAVAAGSWRRARYALIALVNGALYGGTGWQGPPERPREVFQTERRLHRLLGEQGLEAIAELPDSNPFTPSVIARRRTAASPGPAPPGA